MSEIFYCVPCNRFTMKHVCICGSNTGSVVPLKYVAGNRLSQYRRKAKEDERRRAGLL